MTAKQIAIRDIKNSLKQEQKQFIPFKKELNKAISLLIKAQTKEQKSIIRK